MITGSLIEVLNEGKNNDYRKKVLKKKKLTQLSYSQQNKANDAWWKDRIDDMSDYAEEKPGEYLSTVAGTTAGLVMGGLPGAAVGGVIGNLGLKGVKAAGRYLDSIGRHHK